MYVSPTPTHPSPPRLSHTYTQIYTHTRNTHTHTHNTHTRTHTHTHTHMYTHTHTYTHRPKRSFQGRAVATSQVSPVETGPLFPSLVACFLLPHLRRVWLARLVNNQKDAVRHNGQKGWIFIHVKLCHLASEKHRFGPKMVSEAISQSLKFSEESMPPDPACCCMFYAHNLTTDDYNPARCGRCVCCRC